MVFFAAVCSPFLPHPGRDAVDVDLSRRTRRRARARRHRRGAAAGHGPRTYPRVVDAELRPPPPMTHADACRSEPCDLTSRQVGALPLAPARTDQALGVDRGEDHRGRRLSPLGRAPRPDEATITTWTAPSGQRQPFTVLASSTKVEKQRVQDAHPNSATPARHDITVVIFFIRPQQRNLAWLLTGVVMQSHCRHLMPSVCTCWVSILHSLSFSSSPRNAARTGCRCPDGPVPVVIVASSGLGARPMHRRLHPMVFLRIDAERLSCPRGCERKCARRCLLRQSSRSDRHPSA